MTVYCSESKIMALLKNCSSSVKRANYQSNYTSPNLHKLGGVAVGIGVAIRTVAMNLLRVLSTRYRRRKNHFLNQNYNKNFINNYKLTNICIILILCKKFSTSIFYERKLKFY